MRERKFQDGKTPHQLARDGEIGALLRQHYVRHHFDSFLYVIILIGRRPIFGSSSRNGSTRFDKFVRNRPRNGGKNDDHQFASST